MTSRPLLSCECVECPSHRAERERLEARVAELELDLFAARDAVLTEGQVRIALETHVAELEEEDRVKTNADEACAQAAEAEIARLEARVAALTATDGLRRP
jgi:hypothetical protein